MSFSRWYPVSSFYYDPSVKPTKPIANLQAQDEAKMRKIPKGRYDTTYRREYLNFANGYPTNSVNPTLDSYLANKPPPPPIQTDYTIQHNPALDKYLKNNEYSQASNINPFPILPPITQPSSLPPHTTKQLQELGLQPPVPNINDQPLSIDHIVNNSKINTYQSQPRYSNDELNVVLSEREREKPHLPINPIFLTPQEEQNLIMDVAKELRDTPSENLKTFFNDMTTYDPNNIGYVHVSYMLLGAIRNKINISEPLFRYVMSRYVSADQERDTVNYEGVIKFLARCIGNNGAFGIQAHPGFNPNELAMHRSTPPHFHQQFDTNFPDQYDPDEQAILRLMHENMREWDQVNLIDIDQLKRKFYEVDPYNRYILTMREFEDVLYKNRIPIQRSLIFKILEKYCKVSSGQYRWPAFCDFLEKTTQIRMTGKKHNNYIVREGEKDSTYQTPYSYRNNQLDVLRSKATEEERIEEINKQIYNLQYLKNETKQKLDNQAEARMQSESWFTRFMRLANSMYTHRVSTGTEFVLPRDEAKRLVTAYNTVFELNIPERSIDDAINSSVLKGNVVIDNLLKILSKVH